MIQNGSRFCFIGDSLTHTGLYGRFLSDYFAFRLPQAPVNFINCGISGESAGSVLGRLDRDVLLHRPDKASLMLGMNDIGRHLYGMSNPSAEVYRERRIKLDTYRDQTEKIIMHLQENGVELLLLTPTPYEESALLEETCLTGCNGALSDCAYIVQELANKHNCPIIDYYTPMNEINTKLQSVDPHATLIGPDRVHPGALGHRIMAYLFLRQTGTDLNSLLELDSVRMVISCMNRCEADALEHREGRLTFRYRPDGLPLVMDAAYGQADRLVPLDRELNQDTIRIRHLPEGHYEVLLDGIKVSTYTSGELEEGVNPAVSNTSPQQKQARRLHSLCEEKYGLEKIIRSIRYTEKHFGRGRVAYDDLDASSQFVRSLLADQAISAWHREQYETYLVYKPKEEELFASIDGKTQEIYLNNQTAYYQVEIQKLS